MLHWMKFAGIAAAACLCLIAAACSSSATPAPTAQLASTAAPTAQVAPTSAPAAAAAPTSPAVPTAVARPTQATTTSSQATTTSSQGATTGTTQTTLVIDPSVSQASYTAHEQLVGRTLPSDAVGTSKSVSGSLVLGSDGAVLADQSKISVDLSKLQSNESRRDNWIKNDTIQTSRFPMATFVPREVQGLPIPLPTSGEAKFQLLGDLTVHGVTKPVTWQVTAQFADGAVTGNATTNVKITDFGMTPPKVGPVLSIEDALTLELAFSAAP
jgi:polyisoprenoid-binding protein YceI